MEPMTYGSAECLRTGCGWYDFSFLDYTKRRITAVMIAGRVAFCAADALTSAAPDVKLRWAHLT